MNVKRYFAKTAREALRMLKDDLGPDAVVLANRAANGGVEILALPAGDVASLQRARSQAQAAASAAAAAAPVAAPQPKPPADFFDDDFRVSLSRAAAAQPPAPAPAPAPARAAAPRAPEMQPFNPPRVELNRDVFHAASAQVRRPPAPPPAPEAGRSPLRKDGPRPADAAPRQRPPGIEEEARIRALESANSQMASELAAIRGMIERQLAGFAWGEMSRNAPGRARLIGDLLEAGFSASLARELAEEVPEDEAPEEAHRLLHDAMARRLHAMDCDADIIDRGGVFALVGPTGVGKTTTTAKLAARCVVRHGADKLALITTDSYRIGAHEQLRIYGRILGVPVYVVRDATDLRDKHMVLIDTMGMSQRDKMVAEQASMLTGAGKVSRLLLLNATSRGDTLDDVIRAYAGDNLTGVVLTKMDEAVSLAPVLDVAIRHQMDVYYVANGQRVPEDLHLPDRSALLDQALRELPANSPFRLDPLEAGLMMASAGQANISSARGGF